MPRLDTIVGSIFFAALVGGVGLIICGANQPRSSRSNHVWQALGVSLEGLAFLFFGLASIYFSKTSPRPTINGYITELKQHSGKYPSSDFIVAAPSRASAKIHSQYNGRNLHLGDLVIVKYVEYDRTLLDLTIMSGQATGWHLRESDQTFWSGGLVLFGVLFEIGAFRQWLKKPTASEDRDTSENVDAGGPDPSSTLKIR